jgi:hypothetical protein
VHDHAGQVERDPVCGLVRDIILMAPNAHHIAPARLSITYPQELTFDITVLLAREGRRG